MPIERSSHRVARVTHALFRLRAWVAGLVVGALAIAGLGTVALLQSAPAEAAAAPWGCSTGLIYDNASTIRTLQPDGSVVTVSTAPFTPNSIAFDPVDGNLYALAGNTNVLSVVHADGTVTSLGPVANLPNVNYGVAGFSPDGTLWLYNQPTLWKVNVDTLTATSLTTSIPLPNIPDLVWADGSLWTVTTTTQVAKIDPTTGQVTLSSTVGGLQTTPLPYALWYIGGHLFIKTGNGGFPPGGVTVTEIVGFQSNSPTAALAGKLDALPADGASCAAAPSPFVNATDDDFTTAPVPQHSGGAVGNVFPNDTVNGAAATATLATATITDNGGAAGASISADGTLTVPAGTMPGRYTLSYTLCETATATHAALCDPATVAFVIAPPDSITSTDDDFTSTSIPSAGGAIGNVLGNDRLDGRAIDPSDVTVTLTDAGGLGGVKLAADGTLSVTGNAAPGTYTLSYQICEKADPVNCATATIKVMIAAALPANGDPGAGTSVAALAATGSSLIQPLTGAGLLLFMAGGTLLAARRRKRATTRL